MSKKSPGGFKAHADRTSNKGPVFLNLDISASENLFDFYQKPKNENNVERCPERRQISKIKATVLQVIHVGGSQAVHNPCLRIVTE